MTSRNCMKVGVMQSWHCCRKRHSVCCGTWNHILCSLDRETSGGFIEKTLQLMSLFVSGINSAKKLAVS
jgi:hypothetical protein